MSMIPDFLPTLCFLVAAPAVDTLPSLEELDRLPPPCVVALMIEHNQAFQREIDFWWYTTPRMQAALAPVWSETVELYAAWGLLQSVHYSAGQGRVYMARYQMGQFRERWPEWWGCPGSIPAVPHWMFRYR